MKEITYQNGKVFVLTNIEFREACQEWDSNKPYYCERLDSLIGKFFLYAETPKLELKMTVFIDKDLDYRKIYKDKNENYYELLGESLSKLRLEEEAPDFVEKLIKQEDFYNYEGKTPIKMGEAYKLFPQNSLKELADVK